MFFDAGALHEAADCREVARFIGMRTDGRFCECVSGLHSESQMNHCAIYKDHIHCFSCGDNRDVVGMVRGYYQNVLGTPIGYQDALKIIGDACGGYDLYLEEGTYRPVEPMPFTREEMALIGLDAQPAGDMAGARPKNLAALYHANRPLFLALVRENAEDQLERIRALLAALGKSQTEVRVRLELESRQARIRKLYEKVGGKPGRTCMIRL